MVRVTMKEAEAAMKTVEEIIDFDFLVDTLDVPEVDLVDLFDGNTFSAEKDS